MIFWADHEFLVEGGGKHALISTFIMRSELLE